MVNIESGAGAAVRAFFSLTLEDIFVAIKSRSRLFSSTSRPGRSWSGSDDQRAILRGGVISRVEGTMGLNV